jgi:demethylmenaquinone methyltransferase/2-methoxy-6-polyprenyl-1,4-benzoquinol methylase
MTPHRVERFYDTVAPLYGVWARLTESRAAQRALEVAALQPGESVLEVGMGTGDFFSRLSLAAKGGRCVGVDISAEMLRRARRRLQADRRAGLLCRGDALQLPFPPASFDVIFSCYMLDLLPETDIPRALGEFLRVTKPQGRLVVTVMARQARGFDAIWMWVHRHAPALVGGCRPVALAPALAATGWRVELAEEISQSGFRSELFLARPLRLELKAA